jgi:DNA-binding transcriptional MerR regulator
MPETITPQPDLVSREPDSTEQPFSPYGTYGTPNFIPEAQVPETDESRRQFAEQYSDAMDKVFAVRAEQQAAGLTPSDIEETAQLLDEFEVHRQQIEHRRQQEQAVAKLQQQIADARAALGLTTEAVSPSDPAVENPAQDPALDAEIDSLFANLQGGSAPSADSQPDQIAA